MASKILTFISSLHVRWLQAKAGSRNGVVKMDRRGVDIP
jgi:hypothetical protein